jgi:hypothetical protein
MFPAARITDPITHDMVSPCGIIAPPLTGPAPNPVLIEMLPAAYVTCTVVCAGTVVVGMIHPPPPTPPPPIVKGSTTVLINNLPAARWAPSGDLGLCGVFLGMVALTPTRTTLIGG